jgi:hypothetical protein
LTTFVFVCDRQRSPLGGKLLAQGLIQRLSKPGSLST